MENKSNSRGSSQQPSIDSIDANASEEDAIEDSFVNKDFSTDEPTFKNQLDMLNGVPTRLVTSGKLKELLFDNREGSLIEVDRSNAQVRNKYSWTLNGLARLLMCLLVDFDTLIFIALIICVSISKYYEQQDYIWPSILLVFQVIVRITIELLIDDRKRKAAYQFNYSIVKKYFKSRNSTQIFALKKDQQSVSSSFAYDLWQNLKIADIIVVKQGLELPADCLILDQHFLQQSEKKRNVVEGLGETSNSLVQNFKENILVQHNSVSQAKIQTKVCFKGTYLKSRSEGQTKVTSMSVVKLMSGTLIWEWNYKGFFVGQFKFADNSGSYDINSDCVIRKGETLVSNHKLVCLVLNVGRTCQGSVTRKQRYTLTATSFFKKFAQFFSDTKTRDVAQQIIRTRWFMVAMLLFYIIAMFARTRSENLSQFNIDVLNANHDHKSTDYNYQTASDTVLYVISMFAHSATVGPLLFKLTHDIITLFQAYFVEQDIQLAPSEIQFNNLKAMSKLPFIGHVITSPATLEQSHKEKATFFQIRDKCFFSNDFEQQTAVKDQMSQIAKDQVTDDKSIDSVSDNSKEDLLDADYMPHMRQLTDFYFHNQEVTQIFQNKFHQLHDSCMLFLRTICMCQQAVHNLGDDKQTSYFTSYYPEEEAQLMFALQYNYLYSQRKGPVMTIHTNGKLERLDELVYFQMQVPDKKNSVFVQVLRPFNANGNLVINMKGSVNAVIDICNWPTNAAKLFAAGQAERMAQMGYFLQAFCTKELTAEDSKSLREQLDALSVYSKTFQQQLRDICTEHLQGIELVGTLGFQKTVPLRNTLAVQDLMNNSIKVWLLSQLKTKKTMIDCTNMNLMDDMISLNIRGKNQREIEEKLRSALNSVFDHEAKHKLLTSKQTELLNPTTENENDGVFKRLKTQMTNYFYQKRLVNQLIERQKRCLTFDGVALVTILRNDNLLRIFMSLCNFCDLMVGSNISPELKGRLGKELVEFEKLGTESKRRYVLGIIGAPEDTYLVEKCVTDVVICATNQASQRSIQTESDIIISNLYGLTYLLLKHGSQLTRRLVIAGRLHLKRQVFFVIFILCFYFQNGNSEASNYFGVQLGIYMTVVFTTLVVSTSVLHQSDAFGILHRVNGQYLCNLQYSLIGPWQVITFVIDSLFDILTILTISVTFSVQTSAVSNYDGFTTDNRIDGLLVTVLIILQFVTQFIKLPLVSKLNSVLFVFGAIVMMMTLFYEDSDLIGFQSLAKTPAAIFQIILMIGFQFLKVLLKWILRYQVRAVAKWDKYNLYVEERIQLEMFESENQLKHITLDNLAHSQSIIDIFQLHLHYIAELINKNLLKMTNRSDLATIIFDQIGYIKSIKTRQSEQARKDSLSGLGPQYEIVHSESTMQISKRSLKFKMRHIEQDYHKHVLQNYKVDKQSKSHALLQVFSLGTLYLVVFASALQQSVKYQTSYKVYIFNLISSICCFFSYILIKYSLGLRRDRILLLTQIILHGLIAGQIETDDYKIVDLQAIIQSLILWSCFSRHSHSSATAVLCIITASHYTVRLGQLINISTFEDYRQLIIEILSILGVPVTTFICVVYIYWDEFFNKLGFLVMDRRIKEYKKMRLGAQKLVPEIVRKSQYKADNIELNKQLVVIVVKLSNYNQLVGGGQSNEAIFNLMSAVNVGLDRLVLRHSLLRVDSIEDRFTIIGGMKLFEQSQYQKIQSVTAVERGCRFAFDTFALGTQLAKQFKQPVSFQVGIHCPNNIASGVMGNIYTNIVLFGQGLRKAEFIVDRAAPQQVIISKECYVTLNGLNKSHNIKIKEQVRIDNVDENIYELMDLRKKVHMQKALMLNLQSKMGLQLIEPPVQDNESSLNTVSQIDSDVSGQVQASNATGAGEITTNASMQAEIEQTIKEFKDDQEIASNQEMNREYQLVRRPKLLFFLELTEGEQKLIWQINHEFKWVNVFFSSIFTLLLFIFLYLAVSVQGDPTYMDLLWLIPYVIGSFIINFMLVSQKYVKYVKWTHLAKTLILVAMAVYVEVIYRSDSMHYATTQILFVAAIVMFTQRGQKFQDFCFLILLLNFTWIGTTIGLLYNQRTYLQIVKQCFGQLVMAFLLVTESLNREQLKRQDFNVHQMLTVEGNKHKQLVTKILPVQALNALQQEESFVQTLKNGSMLMFQLANFQDFVNSKEVVSKPQIGFKLVDQLYIKFDELVQSYGLFKLFGDTHNYIVVSDPSLILQPNSEKYQVEQALKLVILGQAMVKVVADTCAHMIASSTEISSTATLMRIGSQIGIHSGNALCCIIGQKLKEFKIYGKMPQVCKNARNGAPKDQVCVTKETRDLLKQHTDVSINLVFTENLSIIKEGQRGSFQTYIVVAEQQEMANEESLESYDSEDMASQSVTNKNEEHSDNTGEDHSVSGSETD